MSSCHAPHTVGCGSRTLLETLLTLGKDRPRRPWNAAQKHPISLNFDLPFNCSRNCSYEGENPSIHPRFHSANNHWACKAVQALGCRIDSVSLPNLTAKPRHPCLPRPSCTTRSRCSCGLPHLFSAHLISAQPRWTVPCTWDLPGSSLAEEKQGRQGEFTPKESTLSCLPVLRRDNSGDCFYTISKKVPGGTEAPFASVIMSSLTRRFLAVPPALTFASPRVCFPGITWQTSCLLSVSCPVSVWKNPRKIRRQAGITNGRQGGRRGD
ncbi:uncharacterized protein LOC102157940 isoform X2 [Sus scrofa]|uniref:uncharacterized protein LOC102157940 isoform X2 n=1 Tax=Sus scrofa TaxID=9823 RepID=UPI000A2B70BD|nr:uncharacterized protein LOC102157940 isoform X2 [Sus scrofa]